ncbi:MAG: HD domain-containing protein [Candidatus Moranbacteria bacterium]|nr:HD domain-containing protein [Candidatus Moranbacteria bacterium]
MQKTLLQGKYKKILAAVEKELVCSAHNIEHIFRVYNTALKIAKSEKKVDMEVLKSAILLHDIARVKEDADKTGSTCHAEESAKMSEVILKDLDYSQDKIKKIQNCIRSHRYKTNNRPESIEAKILFDADKIDSLGAIVIMRAGMWLGKNGCDIFPKVPFKKYIKDNLVGGKIGGRIKNPSLHNIFYEHEIKNKKLPSLMYTKMGKKVAEERLKFVTIFLDRLKKEAEGLL